MTTTSIGKFFLGGAVAAMTLSSVLTIPTSASAQSYDQPPPPAYGQPYRDPCQQQKTDREVAGGLLGGIAGAVIGSNVARGGGRTGGAVIGGVAGAAVGAGIGGSSADGCQAVEDQPPPPPPPPPSGGYYAPPPPAMQDQGAYPPPPEVCGTADVRIYFPDGSTERHPQRACRDSYGRYHLVHRQD
jgi:hypothetical protein